jgi:hypothetical protein
MVVGLGLMVVVVVEVGMPMILYSKELYYQMEML